MPNDPQQQTAVAPREKAIVVDTGQFANLMDTARFEHIQRVGTMYANSNMVPDHFKGKQADCVIAVEMALRLGLHPFSLMQSIYVVHGKPGMEAKMVIALINSSGIFVGPLQYKLEGEGAKRQCTAFAVDKSSGQMCEAVCSMEMAKAEGWIDKAGSKWKTLPDLMLQYRAASFFGRLFAPQVLFGMATKEELDDFNEKDVTPAAEAPGPRTLREKLGGIKDAEIVTTHTAAGGEATPPPTEDAQKTTSQPSQAVASEAQGTSEPHPPSIPFSDLLRHAKNAKTKDQGDVVLDALNGSGYTPQQAQEIKDILNSKAYHAKSE